MQWALEPFPLPKCQVQAGRVTALAGEGDELAFAEGTKYGFVVGLLVGQRKG